MPYHKDLDGADEKRLGENQIGTTKRGIGPCYQDKAARKGIRVQDLLDEKIFRLKVETALAQKNPILDKIYGLHTYTVEEICEEYLPYARILKPYMAETAQLLNEAAARGQVDPVRGRAGHAARHRPRHLSLRHVVLVLRGRRGDRHRRGTHAPSTACWASRKPTSRASAAVPFPTELRFAEDGGEGEEAEMGERLCAAGHEFGVTTGRKRRCGWFDAVIARYAAEVNGLTDVALTKLDVLSEFDTIKVCTAYECDGKIYDYFPMQQSVLFHAKPVYEELPGWKGIDISELQDLRGAARGDAQLHRASRGARRRAYQHRRRWAPTATKPSCTAGIGRVPPAFRPAKRADAAKRRCTPLRAIPRTCVPKHAASARSHEPGAPRRFSLTLRTIS